MLNVLLREKNGLTYGVEASYTPYGDTGIASIYFGTDRVNVDRCLALVSELLERLRTEPLSPRQLSMAKKQFTGQLSIAMESKESYMLSAAKSYLVYGEVDSPQVMYGKVMAVTADEVAAAAREVFGDMSYLIYK